MRNVTESEQIAAFIARKGVKTCAVNAHNINRFEMFKAVRGESFETNRQRLARAQRDFALVITLCLIEQHNALTHAAKRI